MSEQHDNNRSSALSPEALGAINTAASKAITEAVTAAVTAVMMSLKPSFESMALTPDKLREAMKPYEDPRKLARELRESLKSKEDEAEIAKMTARRKAMCPHVDKNGRPAICLVHNFPDHQARGVCVVCSDWIHPKEWRIGAPDEKNPRGKAYLVEPHKDYGRVIQLESMQ